MNLWSPNKPHSLILGHRWFFCILVLAVTIIGCGFFGQSEREAAIIVGSRYITVDELNEDLAFISAEMGVTTQHQDPVRDQFIEQIIDRYLILEYGKEQGIKLSKKELEAAIENARDGYTENTFKDALLRECVDLKQWQNQLSRQCLVKKIIDSIIEGVNPPSYQEIKEYYETNKDQFYSPKMVNFRQIVTRTKEAAEQLLKRIHDGEDMGPLAKENSIAPEAENGGEVGWVSIGQLDESMEKVLFSIQPGKVSSVVETPYGYHVFEVLELKPAGAQKLPDVITQIESRLLDQKREDLCRQKLKELRTHFRIKRNPKLLSKLEMS